MSIIRVAIPLLKGKRRFHIDKGRPWSVVEHAILAAVADKPRSVGDLAAAASLPRRLVLEILIRLMRAGWVVLDQRADGVLFSASPEGLAVVDLDELPIVLQRKTRPMNFVIDRVTGTLYRSRELPFYEAHVLRERAERERMVWMEARPLTTYDDPAALVSTLLDDDERFVGMDPAGDRLVDRYALVTVRNGAVEGLPKRAPAELSQLVLEAAKSAPEDPAGEETPKYQPAPPRPYEERDLPATIRGAFHLDDLIIGGKQHEELFLNSIRRARHRLIVHSTFIAEDKFALVHGLLKDAAKRGVLIDILWGEDSEKTSPKSTNATVRKLRREIEVAGFQANFRIHSFSTGSHAKILVADDGNMEKPFAVVGSCNWLSSGFHSFDVSVRLRDPRLVAGVLDQMTALSLGADGHWTELTSEFARMSGEANRQPIPGGPRGDLTLVLGPQHAQYVRKARDNAAERLFVTSHRLGAANRTAVIVPAIAAAEDRGVTVSVYYGIPTGTYTSGDAVDVTTSAERRGVQVRSVHEPRLHAKVLAWDTDHVVITSQNWLSADPSEANLRREIGVYIHAKGAARTLIDQFEALRRE